MSLLRRFAALGLAAVAGASVAAATPRMFVMYTSGARLNFSCDAMGVLPVNGRFSRFAAAISIDEREPSSARVVVKIDAASLDLDHGDWIDDLRGPDFFDVDRYPHAEFNSYAATLERPGVLKVQGMLTLKGQSRPLTMRVRYDLRGANGQRSARIEADSTLDRSRYGMTGYGLLIGDDVDIKAEGTLFEEPIPPALTR